MSDKDQTREHSNDAEAETEMINSFLERAIKTPLPPEFEDNGEK